MTFIFNFSKKGLGLVSAPQFVYDFSRKMFLMLHSIIWPNFIVWLPLLLEILGNMCITIDTWPKSQNKKLNISRTKKTFEVKLKAFFIIFKGLSVAKTCLRPESAPLILIPIFTKQLCWSLFFHKVADPQPCNFIK